MRATVHAMERSIETMISIVIIVYSEGISQVTSHEEFLPN